MHNKSSVMKNETTPEPIRPEDPLTTIDFIDPIRMKVQVLPEHPVSFHHVMAQPVKLSTYRGIIYLNGTICLSFLGCNNPRLKEG